MYNLANLILPHQTFSMYYVAKSLISNLPNQDPEREQHEQARVKAVANLRRLDRSRDDNDDSEENSGKEGVNSKRARKEDLVLDQYESQIAMEVVAPEDIPVGFDGWSFYTVFGSPLMICRYRRAGRYHRRVKRIRYISSHHASPLFTFIASSRCAIRGPLVWTTRLWQNNARKSTGA